MKLVKQFNPFSCTVACVESVLADYEIIESQQNLIYKFPNIFNGLPEAKRPGECFMMFDIPLVFSNYGLMTIYKGELEIDRLAEINTNTDNIIFIVYNTPRLHCCRYISLENNVVSIMNPWEEPLKRLMSLDELKEKKGKIIYFTKQKEI